MKNATKYLLAAVFILIVVAVAMRVGFLKRIVAPAPAA